MQRQRSVPDGLSAGSAQHQAAWIVTAWLPRRALVWPMMHTSWAVLVQGSKGGEYCRATSATPCTALHEVDDHFSGRAHLQTMAAAVPHAPVTVPKDTGSRRLNRQDVLLANADPDAPVDVSPKRRRSRSRDSIRAREHRRRKRHKHRPRSSHRVEASGDEQASPERGGSREHTRRRAPHKRSRTEASGVEHGSPERRTDREQSSRHSHQKRSRHACRHGSEQLSDGASTDTGREHRNRRRKSKRRRRSLSPAAALEHGSPPASGGVAASADLRARVRAMLGQL